MRPEPCVPPCLRGSVRGAIAGIRRKRKAAAPRERNGRFTMLRGIGAASARLADLTGREAARADADALVRAVVGHDARGLQVRTPDTLGLVVRVADVVPAARPLSADLAESHRILLVP